GIDPAKDQSYFLYDLTEEQLAAARFPVGSLTKDEVRAHARRARLPTADKEESQEICFVPVGTRAGEFVAREAAGLGLSLPSAPGRVEDSTGKTLGAHDGHFRFTIGQRRGIGVSATERLYVLEVDAAENRVVVGPARDLESREALVGDLPLIAGARTAPCRAAARIRHRADEVPATVFPSESGEARVVFDRPVRAVTPGQSCVLYELEGDVVLGGGVIRRSAKTP